MAAEVLASRPGLGDLCVDGPVPSGLAAGGDGGFVASEGDAVSVGVLCRADRLAPLGGLATIDLYGQGTHVVIGPDRSVSITADQDSVTEGGRARFTVTVDPPPAERLEVTVTVTQRGDVAAASYLGAHVLAAAPPPPPPAESAEDADGADGPDGPVVAGIDFGAPDYSGDSVVFGFYVATADDDVVEADGAVTAAVAVADGLGYRAGPPASVTVRNDDFPTVTVAAVTSPVTEGDPGDAAVHARFTVTADQAPAADTTVHLTVTETADQIPAAAKGATTVVIAAGATTADLRVPVPADNTVEADSTATATITTGDGYTIGTPASASVTVRDDDVPAVTITAGPDVYEGSPARFTVTADQAPLADTTLHLTVAETGNQLRGGQAGDQSVVLKAGRRSVIHPVLTEPTVTINDNDEVLLGIRGLGIACNSGRGLIEGASTNFCVFNSDRNRASVDIDYTIYLTYNPYGRLTPWQEGLNKAAASTSCVVQGTDVVLLDWIDGTFGEDAEWDDAIKGSGALRGTIPAGSLISLAWDVEVCDDTVVEGRERIGLVVRLEAAGRTRTFPNSPVYVRDND